MNTNRSGVVLDCVALQCVSTLEYIQNLQTLICVGIMDKMKQTKQQQKRLRSFLIAFHLKYCCIKQQKSKKRCRKAGRKSDLEEYNLTQHLLETALIN